MSQFLFKAREVEQSRSKHIRDGEDHTVVIHRDEYECLMAGTASVAVAGSSGLLAASALVFQAAVILVPERLADSRSRLSSRTLDRLAADSFGPKWAS